MTVAALCTAALLAVTAPALSGDAIFVAAQSAATNATYPVYASYTLDVAFTNASQRVHESWQTIEDIRTATVLAALFSTQESANPIHPPSDPIGNVAFAIDQTFGLAPPRTYVSGRVLNSPAPAASARTFRFFGGVAGPERRYAARLIDTVAGEHGSEYHLALTPLIDPARDRLREVWIATDTMALDAAVVAGIGNRPPTSMIPWKISFVTLSGAPYIAREVALAPLDYGTQGVLRDVTIDFTDLQFTADYPTRYAIDQQASNPLHDP